MALLRADSCRCAVCTSSTYIGLSLTYHWQEPPPQRDAAQPRSALRAAVQARPACGPAPASFRCVDPFGCVAHSLCSAGYQSSLVSRAEGPCLEEGPSGVECVCRHLKVPGIIAAVLQRH